MSDSASRHIRLNVPMITRLEGEGALELEASGGQLESVHLRLYEPLRFFEAFIEGKHYSEVANIVARICGICPIAYQMTAVRAMEKLFGVAIPSEISALRRVTQCGEWLQSHALHIHFLAAPDYLGFEHLMAMNASHPELVRRGMRLQRVGNQLLRLQGGRSVHPIGLKVGGYTCLPKAEAVSELLIKLEEAQDDAEAMVRWVAELELPVDQQSFLSVACCDQNAYPMNEGEIAISDGTVIGASDYPSYFQEHQEPHSTALFSLYHGLPYLVGPLARMNLNFERLPDRVKQVANELGWSFPSKNIYHSIRARALECYLAVVEARRILKQPLPEESCVDVTPCAGIQAHVTEAPRGMIYHNYQIDDDGYVRSGSIIPPTSQNQARIEQDLIDALGRYGLDHSDEELKFFCERLIRNYDPCISCSVHFLNLIVHRTD